MSEQSDGLEFDAQNIAESLWEQECGVEKIRDSLNAAYLRGREDEAMKHEGIPLGAKDEYGNYPPLHIDIACGQNASEEIAAKAKEIEKEK